MPADYKIVHSPELIGKVEHYIAQLRSKHIHMGQRLRATIAGNGLNISNITAAQFLACLLKTKKPKLFAENPGDVLTKDPNDPKWNKPELDILGDIVIATDHVKFYDNGHWNQPKIHPLPLEGGLLFVSGALLKPAHSPDRDDIVLTGHGSQSTINRGRLKALYLRRLLPALIHANEDAGNKGVKGFINIPGLGCGEFAGDVKDAVCAVYPDIVNEIIQENIGLFPHIDAFYIASPGANSRSNIMGASDVLFGDPLSGPQQLDDPKLHGAKYTGCKPYKVVAADHASWPCNDWYVASRWTDEGVIGAATSAMQAMTGFEGVYSHTNHGFQHPDGYINWEDVVKKNQLTLGFQPAATPAVQQVGAAAGSGAAAAAAEAPDDDVKSADDLSPAEQLKAVIYSYALSGRFIAYPKGRGPGVPGFWEPVPEGRAAIERGTSRHSRHHAVANQHYQVELNDISNLREPLVVFDKQNGFRKLTNAQEINRVLKGMVDSLPKALRDDSAKRYGALVRAEPTMTVHSPFLIADAYGNNYVDSISKNSDDSFTIKGRNSNDEPREITLFQDGRTLGFNGNPDLGIVGNQFFEARAAIFEHFGLNLSEEMPGQANGRSPGF